MEVLSLDKRASYVGNEMTFLLPLVSFLVAPFGSLLNTDTRSPTCTNQEINKKDEKLETKTKTDNEYQLKTPVSDAIFIPVQNNNSQSVKQTSFSSSKGL